jgi:hypothetical protein
VKTKTRFLILLANGFVCYYFWIEHQHGMPVARMALFLFFSLIAINLALFLGQRLGENRAEKIAERRGQRR